MKKLKLLIIAFFFLLQLPTFAQVQVDHAIQLTGSGNNARVSGIHSVTDSADATSVAVIQNGRLIYAMAGGSSNTFVLNLTPSISAYDTGMVFNFISNQNVTGAATLNVNNLGAIPITKYINQSLTGCEIQTGQAVTVLYDGTNFQITSVFAPLPAPPGAISGTDSVCPNATGVVYSISPVNWASGYNWTVPAGATITANTGTSITVSFGANPAGNITVAASNACPTSAAGTLTVVSVFCVTATGATITNSGGYTYYTFSDTGSFTFSVSGNNNVDVLVVAGGGAGGGDGGGGGGGGGVIYKSNYSVSTGSYSVTVGAGGAGQDDGPPNNGENSSFGTTIAIGGGGGGSRDAYVSGNTGGSGGGGGGGSASTGGPDTLNQGNPGGNGIEDGCESGGGGGGGAGTEGIAGSYDTGGNGGNGVSYFGNVYGGGGGGGMTCSPGTVGMGGTGGGGNGGIDVGGYGTGMSGTNGLGGGGGGAGGVPGDYNFNVQLGGSGGSGVVIIRYHP